ncbi:MAG TPA: phosphoenolpyruvate--protein phosphotransferase [Thermoanaerobaculia bacterium]|nr:phosphoenolpyruvate--protein phosphotransferase [Thermoanaerobaculia bacterium]
MSARGPMQALRGIGVSEGIAIGRAVVIARREVEIFRIPIPEDAIERELERFRAGREETLLEIERNRAGVDRMFGEELSTLFEAHALLLADRTFVESIESKIRNDRVNAEWAVHEVALELTRRFASIHDDYLRERGLDLEDVSRQLLRRLQGIDQHEVGEVEGSVVLVAYDLVPSEAIRFGRGNVVGFVIEAGSRTSHTSIIARSLGIPAVVAVHGATELVDDEDPIVVDGRAGEVVIHPTAQTLGRYEQVRAGLARVAERSRLAVAGEVEIGPAATRDGVEVELAANIDLPEELELLTPNSVRGIGLYRSEFLYMETDPRLPTEADHLAMYERLIAAAAPYPAVIRTYDLGGRKLAREMMGSSEENPVLGLRGIRLTLARPQIFRLQLRALLRAGLTGNLWIMAPLVSRVEEIRQLRSMLEQLAAELDAEGVARAHEYKVGIMIEVPAAVMIADQLAREADFFAVGTNDLIQYTLAVDRNNESVSDLYQPLHPAILRMLRSVAASGRAAGIPVSICGEMGGDARYAPLLVGLGIRRISAHPKSIPRLRRVVRDLDAASLAVIADACCDLSTADEVGSFLDRAVAAHESAV